MDLQGQRQDGQREAQPAIRPIYQAATKQNRKLKAVLAKMERLSRTALARLAKQAEHTD
jgi:hypothetical protein